MQGVDVCHPRQSGSFGHTWASAFVLMTDSRDASCRCGEDSKSRTRSKARSNLTCEAATHATFLMQAGSGDCCLKSGDACPRSVESMSKYVWLLCALSNNHNRRPLSTCTSGAKKAQQLPQCGYVLARVFHVRLSFYCLCACLCAFLPDCLLIGRAKISRTNPNPHDAFSSGGSTLSCTVDYTPPANASAPVFEVSLGVTGC